MANRRQVKRLFDLEIDEVSLVDRPANQFGKVAFSKRAEDGMRLYDAETGEEVFEDELEHGQEVVGEDGREFVFYDESSPEYDELAADVDDAFEDFDDDGDFDGAYEDDDRELAGVGKSARRTAMAFARGRAGGGNVHSRRELRAAQRGRSVRRRAGAGADYARGVPGAAREYASSNLGARAGAARESGRNFRARQATPEARRNRRRAGAYIGGGALAGAGADRGFGKGLGASLYEELSKALTQRDRDEAISKVLDVVDAQSERMEELYSVVGKMADDAALGEFSKLAETYGPLPVHPSRLGQIMKRAADTLPEEDVEILDRLFTSVGEQLYTEVGKSGTGASVDVWDQVEALAGDVVAKSDMTPEQAITAIFAENPDAYDEYVAEHAAAINGR